MFHYCALSQRWGLLFILLLFRFADAAAQLITGFTPSTGAPGTVVTVTGSNLSGVTGLAFNGVPTTGITILSSTSLTAYVPVNATSGPLRATSPSSSGTSANSFTVVPAKADVTVAVTPAGPLSACGGPTLTAVASTRPFALAGSGIGGYPHVVAVQPDGKILVGGYFDSYNGITRGGVFRLNANGSLDPTFAPTGSGLNYDVDAMVLQPDGKVLVGGKFSTYNGASCRYLTRLNADGTRDASFNLTGTGLNSFVQSLALQPDGKIMVGGTFSNYNSTIRNVVLRLNADGSLDTSFAIAGTGITGNITTIAVQPNGQLLVGGYIERFNGAAPGSLVRLYPNGTLDNTFRVTPLSGSTVLTQALQADGRILISAAVYGPNGRQQAIARLLTNGSLDYSFSPVGSGLNSAVKGLGVQPDGKVVVAGVFNEYNGLVRNYITRLNADGTLDTSFSVGTGPSYGSDNLALQPDGKILIVGTFSKYNDNGPGKMVRLNADGSQDVAATPLAGAAYAWLPSGATGATIVPGSAGGSYQATATVNGSLYLSNTVSVTPCVNAPTITSFTPTSGPVGTVLTVNGTNLTGTTSISFSGSTSNVVSSGFAVNAAGTQLTGVVVPAGAQTGPFNVANSGGFGTSPGSFTVTSPVITSLSPASVAAGSNALSLTVNGSNFVRGAIVNFNGVNLTTTYLSDTQLTAQVPKASIATAGSYPVRVANSAVSGNSTSAAATFTVTTPVPTIASFTPTYGPVGTAVSVTGTNLTGTTAVTLNGMAVSSFAVANATTLIFTVPTGASSGLIAITTPGGTATSTTSFTVGTPNLVPVITSISPSSVLVNSDAFTLTVTGGNFVHGSVIDFPLGAVSTTYVSGSQLTAQVPAAYVAGGLTSGFVTVTSPAPGGGTSNRVQFSVTLPEPTITSFTPASGPVGTTVTVKGANFQLVKYVGLAAQGNAYASFTVLDATTLTFVVPAGSASGPVGVTTSGGTGYSFDTFTVTAAPTPGPTITGLAPSTVVAGSGDFTLTVNGTGFIGSSVVYFDGKPLVMPSWSATRLTALVPASAVATAGTASVVVSSTAVGGGTTAPATFTITAPAPTLTSFTPVSGLVGTAVTVTGTNLTGATAVTLNGSTVGSFTVVNATTLTFIVPTGATSGSIAITTPGGVATNPDSFTVTLPAPTIANLAPGTVVAGSGDFTLVVNGTGFLPSSVVSLAGTVLGTTYTSATQLTAAVPAAAVATAGTYAVAVANPSAALGGTSAPATFTVTTPAPTLLSFAPASGLVGTTVTVTGTNLAGATAVTLNGALVGSFAVVNATTLSFTVPANATSGLVAVTTPSGTATSADSFTVLQPNPQPTLASLSPNTVVAGSPAFMLTLTGTGFVPASVVQLAGTVLGTTYVSATQLTAQVPTAALGTAGSYGVVVVSPAPGGGTTAELPLTVTVPAPTITSFTPASGAAGATVTVVGTNLTGAITLTLNGQPVSAFTVASPSALSFVVPLGATSGLLTVTTPGGTATSATVFAVIEPNPLPAISSLAPATAVAGSSAFTLTITGSGFIAGSSVVFAGTALGTTYVSATQLTAQVPASAVAVAGSYEVLVINSAPGGGTSAPATFTVTTPAPTLLSFAPASGLVGTTVTVTGTNLAGATAVTLHGISVGSFSVVDAATITFVVPAGATSGLLAVTTPGGTATSTTAFTVLLPAPTIAGLAPGSVVAGSGSFALVVTGTGFVNGSVVSFGTTALGTTYDAATQLTAQVPAALVATAGPVSVTVANPSPEQGGTSAAATFTVTAPVVPAPVIVSFSPASGLVGTTVTVTGTNLTGATTVTLNGAPVGSFTVVDATTLTFTVPTGASSGPIAVTTPGGTATSTSTFTVLLPNPAPAISSLSPASAMAGSGALMLTITGTGFLTSSLVQFSGVALGTTYVSATQLTAIIPATALATAGTYAVAVENPAPGGGTASTNFTVTTPAPTLVNFTPASGPVGTLVTVIGTNLTGATAITLNGAPVTGYTLVDATSLTFTVPTEASSGPIAVTTLGGTATSASAFTVVAPNPAPTLASLSPGTVVAGSANFTLTLTGTGFITSSVVVFNGVTLGTTYASATQLTALVPASAVVTAGSYDVAVRNPAPGGGTSPALPFAVTVPAPTISSFTPATGGTGTLVTVTGTNLTGATQVRIGSTVIPTFTVVSATSLTLVVPAASGTVSGLLSITTPGGTATSTTAFSGVLAATSSQALPQLQVYPNPFQTTLTVVLPGTGPVRVALRDVTGRLLLPLTTLPASRQLELPADLASGVYWLEVHQGEATATRRLLKQ